MSSFSKEENVAFEDILEGFNDAMVMSHNVKIHKSDAQSMERSSDTIWRPMPYVSKSFDGADQTGNFGAYTQLSVPASIGFQKSVPWQMTTTELRDMLQENRLGEAARQKLGSDINGSVRNVASMTGSIVIKRTAAASGYDDLAEAEASMDELGVDQFERVAALASRDYNGMAGNLAARETMSEMPTEAFRKSYVGGVAGFETFKLDTASRLTASAGTTVTINGANQYYTPAATSTASTGETSNVDNRFQTITIAVSSGTVKVGDAFTTAGVNSVHHITKEDTGQLKTHRITEIVTGAGGSGTVKITPPFISAGGSTLAEEIYKNVETTPADGAAITFLNTTTAYANPFWLKGSIELLPGTYPVPDNAGIAVMRGTTDQGIELVMQKSADINTGLISYRFDTRYGVVNTCPEMNGIILFGQA
tara:strand:+ start:91 stop:1356 length:1266 start_codon:yes stop_codon:yes gene_type:complete